MTREAFITLITTGLGELPKFFYYDICQNKVKVQTFEEVVQKNLKFEKEPNFDELLSQGVVLLDTRTISEF